MIQKAVVCVYVIAIIAMGSSSSVTQAYISRRRGAPGRRNRSGRVGDCPINNLTNGNFCVRIVSTAVNVNRTKTQGVGKCIAAYTVVN